MLRNIGTIFSNYVFLPAYDMLANTYGEARIRLANMAKVMILAFPVAIFFHVWLHSAIPIWLYSISAGIVALLIAIDFVNVVAVIDVSFAWFGLVNQALRTVLTGLGVPAAQINQAIEAVKAEVSKFSSGANPTVRGVIGAGLNAFLTVVQVPALAGAGATKAVDAVLAELDKLLTERRQAVVQEAKTKLANAGRRVAFVEFWLVACTAFFGFFPAWKFPLAAAGVVAGGVLLMLALPNNRQIQFNKYSTWGLVISGAILVWTMAVSPHDLYSVAGSRLTLAAMAAIVVIAGLRIIGTMALAPFLILAIAAVGQMFPSWAQRQAGEYKEGTHIEGKKWRVTREGGCRKFYPVEVNGTNLTFVTDRGGLSNGEFYFRPLKTPANPTAEQLQPGDILCQLEEGPTVGHDRELYVWVVLVGDDDLPAIDVERESFYIPLKYLTEVKPANFTAGYISIEPPSRIDPREGYLGRERLRARFANLSPFPSPFVEAPLASPLEDRLARVANVFRAPRGNEEHLAVDLLPSGNKRTYPVLAAADGVVDDLTLADPYYSITLLHAPIDGDTIWTHYGHLHKVADGVQSGRLKVGARVKQGEKIGEISASNRMWYQEGIHLHFAVLGRSPGDNYTRPRDPLRYLGRVTTVPFDINGIGIYALLLEPSGQDSSEYWVPPNFVVGVAPVFVEEGDDVEIQVLSGSYFPNEDWGEPDNREVGPAGLSGVPKYGFQYVRAVPKSPYAALAYGVNGLQSTFTDPTFSGFHAKSRGWLCLGLNEFVVHCDSEVYHDGAADNTGAGFRVRVKVTRQQAGGRGVMAQM